MCQYSQSATSKNSRRAMHNTNISTVHGVVRAIDVLNC